MLSPQTRSGTTPSRPPTIPSLSVFFLADPDENARPVSRPPLSIPQVLGVLDTVHRKLLVPTLASRRVPPARRSPLRRLCLPPPAHAHAHIPHAHTARLRSVLLRLLLILFEGCVHDGPSNEDDHEEHEERDDGMDDGEAGRMGRHDRGESAGSESGHEKHEKTGGAPPSPRLRSTSCPPKAKTDSNGGSGSGLRRRRGGGDGGDGGDSRQVDSLLSLGGLTEENEDDEEEEDDDNDGGGGGGGGGGGVLPLTRSTTEGYGVTSKVLMIPSDSPSLRQSSSGEKR